MFTSPRHLNLVLLCQSPYRSVKEMLGIWPELPIYVHDFGFSSKEAIDDLVAALRLKALNHRVSGIRLARRLDIFSPSGWETFAPVMQQSFPALTHLWLQPYFEGPVSRSFLGGSAPSLQDLHLSCVSFPALPELLLSATNIVRLDYEDISPSGYIPPQAMVAGLSALTRLESLSFTFQSPEDLPDRAIRIPPPHMRTLLPALTDLCFKGSSEYMEDLVAQIDTPLLESVQITLFNLEVLEVSELAKFIHRTDKLSLPHQAELTFISDHISITLSPKLLLGKNGPKTLKLKLASHESAFRLSYVAQFCASCLPTLSQFESLHIHDSIPWQDVVDDLDPQWLELLCLFTTVKDLRLSRTVTPHVAQALRGLEVERVTAVLPALENVFIHRLKRSAPAREAISEFADARQLSGHPVSIQIGREKLLYE